MDRHCKARQLAGLIIERQRVEREYGPAQAERLRRLEVDIDAARDASHAALTGGLVRLGVIKRARRWA